VSHASGAGQAKPRLLFLRPAQDSLPDFIARHLHEQTRCLETFFDVSVVPAEGDYQALCEEHRPDLAMFESGVYTKAPRHISNTHCFPEIPKIGFLHCDAYCPTRSVFFSDMERWGVTTFFTLSVSIAEYTPEIADRLFVWPSGFDPSLYRDYGEAKTVPVLFVGSQAPHYPWRNRIRSILANRYPMLSCPHFGWFDREKTATMIHGEAGAHLRHHRPRDRAQALRDTGLSDLPGHGIHAGPRPGGLRRHGELRLRR
jgi:hypothetical protein